MIKLRQLFQKILLLSVKLLYKSNMITSTTVCRRYVHITQDWEMANTSRTGLRQQYRQRTACCFFQDRGSFDGPKVIWFGSSPKYCRLFASSILQSPVLQKCSYHAPGFYFSKVLEIQTNFTLCYKKVLYITLNQFCFLSNEILILTNVVAVLNIVKVKVVCYAFTGELLNRSS